MRLLRHTLHLAVLAALAAAPARAVPPSDFRFEGIAGGRAPWEEVTKVVVDSAGNGAFYVMVPENRATGTFVPSATFTLSSTELNTLWTAVQSNGFFALAPLYDSGAFDGSFCRLVIKGGGQLDTTITLNIAVAGIDNIVTTLNGLTPGSADLLYNAILPAPQQFPTRIRGGGEFLAGQGTTVTRAPDGCRITITINIDILGALANAATAAAYKADIEEKWNRPNSFFSWCPITFVASVNNGATKGAHHQITVVAPANRSFVNNPLPAPNAAGGSGSWRSNAGADNGAAHEAGHLMGLNDQYKDDPKTGASVPNAGHEHDIMATKDKTSDPPAGPRQDAIESIINAAGVTCPEICCIFDPIPIPPYVCSVGSTCTDFTRARNESATVPLAIINSHSTNPAFSVSPPSAFIPPLGLQQFQVDFSPLVAGSYSGYIVFARQSPSGVVFDSVGVSGQTPPASVPVLPPGGVLALGGALAAAAGWRLRRRR